MQRLSPVIWGHFLKRTEGSRERGGIPPCVELARALLGRDRDLCGCLELAGKCGRGKGWVRYTRGTGGLGDG
jgi:hypothetical protein